MSSSKKTIIIECSAEDCEKPLEINEGYYKYKMSWGQKKFYHSTCKKKNVQLVNSGNKSLTGLIYPEKLRRNY